jgi:gluconokinase
MFVSVDIGTSSVKVGLVDRNLNVLKEYIAEVPLITYAPLVAEHDLKMLWDLTIRGIQEVVKGYEGRVEAISLSTYLHGLAVLSRDSEVIMNVMTHLDRRCSSEQSVIDKEGIGYELYRRTGCPPIFVFPLCKALWLVRKGMLKSGCRLSLVKDYIAYKLTGNYVVDYGVASGSGFLNIHNLKWEPLALELSQVSEDMLPELYEGAKVYDYITLPNIGIRNKVALVLGSFDGALQNLGYGVFREDAVLNLGSTAVIRTLLHDPVIDKSSNARFFVYYAADGYRVVGGASNNGMTVIEWVRKNFIKQDLELSEEIVCRDGVYVLPFLTGERYPFRDPNLTFTVLGLRLEHNQKHFLRAIVEGIAFTVKSILDAIEENNVVIERVHCAGGGCNYEEFIKVFSNILCKPIAIHSKPREAVILGASNIVRRALGYLRSFEELRDIDKPTYVHPDISTCKIYLKCSEKFVDIVKKVQNLNRVLLEVSSY